VIGTRQYREMESSCASAPPAREPENIEAAGKARERESNASDPLTAPKARKGRETNAPCQRETESMGAWETNMPERETAAVRRDGELLTSAVQERRQEEAAAEQHQAAVGEPPVMEGTEPVTSSVTDPRTGSRDAVDTAGRQLTAASGRAETSHMDPRPLNEPTAKPGLEAVCMPAGY
jgi:hypothetical protein